MHFKLIEKETLKIAGYVSAPSWEEAEIFLISQFDMYISDVFIVTTFPVNTRTFHLA
jgi:hypothetical protein